MRVTTTNGTTRFPGVRSAGGILDRIVEAKAKRLTDTMGRVPISELIERVSTAPRSRASHSFAAAVRRRDRVTIIAEIKKQSPSKGVIREDFDPAGLAESYVSGGAAALSVLAEEDFFGGSLEHLKVIRNRVALPLLRKDFIIDEYQLYESVLAGADAVLLIVAILEDEPLAKLIGLAGELGVDALVEVHNAGEMKRAARAGAGIIGVNNRDLTTFSVDLSTSVELVRIAPRDAILISESGINTASDIRRLRSAGFSACLVGERLMRADDPGAALKDLIDEAEG